MNRLPALALGLVCLAAAPAGAWFEEIVPILVEGDPAPDGDGVFSGVNSFSPPTINEGGDVAFLASFSATTHLARVLVSTPSGLEQRVRSNTPAPRGSGTISSLWAGDVAIDAQGQVVLGVTLSGTPGGPDENSAIVLAGSEVVEVVREGDDPGDANGELTGFRTAAMGLDEDGNVSFWATARGSSPPLAANSVVYRGNGGSPMKILREGDPVPDAGGVTFGQVDGVLYSSRAGGAAIRTLLEGTAGGADDNQAIFVSEKSLTRRVTKGDPSPDGDGTVATFGSLCFLSNDSMLACELFLDPMEGEDSEWSLATYPAVGPGTIVVREGDAAPSGGFFAGQDLETIAFATGPRLAFASLLTGTSGGVDSDDIGLFLSTESSILELARRGEPTPDGDGEFDDFRNGMLHVNEAGDVVVYSTVRGSTSLGGGIFLFRDRGAVRTTVIREGQPLLGSTVSSIAFLEARDARQAGRSAISSRGEIAFTAYLDDGRDVVMVSVPEAAAGPLQGAALVALLALRRWRSRRRR